MNILLQTRIFISTVRLIKLQSSDTIFAQSVKVSQLAGFLAIALAGYIFEIDLLQNIVLIVIRPRA